MNIEKRILALEVEMREIQHNCGLPVREPPEKDEADLGDKRGAGRGAQVRTGTSIHEMISHEIACNSWRAKARSLLRHPPIEKTVCSALAEKIHAWMQSQHTLSDLLARMALELAFESHDWEGEADYIISEILPFDSSSREQDEPPLNTKESNYV